MTTPVCWAALTLVAWLVGGYMVIGALDFRTATASVAPAQLLAKYETRRKQSNRVAIAELIGPACGGCHLDLSQAERDQLRRLLDDEIPECPHCGCMLVL